MTRPSHSVAPEAEALLRAAVRAVRSGNKPAARAILRSLTRDFPDEVRGWMGLTEVAADDEERIRALEHVVALAPENERARQALDRLRAAAAPTLAAGKTEVGMTTFYAASAPTVEAAAFGAAPAYQPLPRADTPPVPVEEERHQPTGWLWPIVAIALLLLAGVACLALLAPFWLSFTRPTTANLPAAEATAPLQQTEAGVAILQASATIGAPVATGAPPATSTAASQPLAQQTAQATSANVAATRVSTPATNVSTPATVARSITSTPLAPGALLELDSWRVSLPRQERLLLLDGAVGEAQPKGHFVLAVVSLANMSSQPRRMPADLFVLIDERGQRYHPVPTLSTSYLAAYGRGLRGDLSMEDEMPAGGGYFSVPVLFDVPRGVGVLRLSIGDGSVGGWEVPGRP